MNSRASQRSWQLLAAIAGVILYTGGAAQAATLCVDTTGTATPGAGECFALPSQAVAASVDGDIILIHSGTYMESAPISISRVGLKILCDDPRTTLVQNPSGSVFLMPFGSYSAEIANCRITGGGSHGIELGGQTTTVIHHNVVEANSGWGIASVGSAWNRTVSVYNNVVRNNNSGGMNFSSYTTATVFNNILTRNQSSGLVSGLASYNSSFNNGPVGTSNYSNTTGNIGNISTDCLFVDEAGGDLRLQPGSPCRDTGHPGYLDVDGTISDMGIYGGPASAAFWPYGNGGPVITNLTVTPPIVPEGGQLSIKATVEIR